MYTILVDGNNNLITTVREVIMQRSKLVNSIQFLVSPIYGDLDLTDGNSYTTILEYYLPVSRKYGFIELTPEQELYKERLQYIFPVDTNFTAEAGKVELQLTWYKIELGDDGVSISSKQQVRKTSVGHIHVTPISAWSDIIPDPALTALDQRIMKMDGTIKAIEEIQDAMSAKQVDGLYIDPDTFELQVSANNVPVGNKIPIVVPRLPDTDDGVNDGIVELEEYKVDDPSCDCGCDHGIVEL